MGKTRSGSGSKAVDEAVSIVNGARQAQYGSPHVNHGTTARLWTEYCRRRLLESTGAEASEFELTARDVCALNVLQKLSRDIFAPKDDNIVDIIGYAMNMELIKEAEECGKNESE